MTEFNYRTTVNHQLQLNKAATRRESRKARQNIEYRRRHAALRSVVRTVAIDAALVGASLAGCIAAVVCAII